jgi:hypothetical protein
MARVTLFVTALAIALVGAVASTATAQDTRDRTFLTFSAPVEMPGVTLQAGTYVFKLADTPSRNVVEVWNRDEKNMIGHWLFVQAQRPRVSQETVVMFKETAAGTTPAVQFWYYPGESLGKEFVYPKSQALKLAARTNSRVLSTEGEITSQSSVSSVDASGKVTEWKREKSSESASGAGVVEGQQARAAEPRAPEPREPQLPAPAAQGGAGRSNPEVVRQPQPARSALPQTSSPLALSGLIGLLSLAGAAGIRFLR